MVTNILIAAICVVAFLTSFWAYRRGIKDGLALRDNKPIEPIKTPVAVIREHTETKEASEVEKVQAQFMTNLFGYDGSKQDEVNK